MLQTRRISKSKKQEEGRHLLPQELYPLQTQQVLAVVEELFI